MLNLKLVSKLEWVLRLGVFGTFIGHGLIAISVNPSWMKYLAFFGFTNDQIIILMPIIGAVDIIVATVILIKPNKFFLLWAVFWGLATALIRPIAGEDILAFVERAANWAVPLALFFFRADKKG